MRFLYGRFTQEMIPIDTKNMTLMAELNKINLRKFFISTRPRCLILGPSKCIFICSYTIKKCFFGRFNCKRNFRLVGTLAGTVGESNEIFKITYLHLNFTFSTQKGICLQLDPNHHTGFSSHDVLTLSLKIKSDVLPTGWAPVGVYLNKLST